MSFYWVIGCFIMGMIIGRFVKKKPAIHKFNEKLTMLAIFLLLFLLGVSVGINPDIIKNLPSIGFQAIFLSLGAISGTLLLAWGVVKLFFKDERV